MGDEMTSVYFVRHAQPVFGHEDDRTRPLTRAGMADRAIVLETLKDKGIDVIYCSPYLRSVCTIQEVADYYKMNIHTDERLREREKGAGRNTHELIQKRWEDFDYHEDGGESIRMVQKRNVEALKEILEMNNGKNIVIGTHGTALSSIMNYYMPEFGYDDFFRLIDWMPYIVCMNFEGQKLLSICELAHIEKEYKGKTR